MVQASNAFDGAVRGSEITGADRGSAGAHRAERLAASLRETMRRQPVRPRQSGDDPVPGGQ